MCVCVCVCVCVCFVPANSVELSYGGKEEELEQGERQEEVHGEEQRENNNNKPTYSRHILYEHSHSCQAPHLQRSHKRFTMAAIAPFSALEYTHCALAIRDFERVTCNA